jgi:predicted TIM-barrel fold metal-dependent hydrolase
MMGPGDGLSRRNVVAAGVAAAASASTARATAKSGLIDVHHHFIPSAITPGIKVPAPPGPPNWTLEGDLEDMERAGVDRALLSMPLIGDLPSEVLIRAAREINEAAAKLSADRPTRFAPFAVLPLPEIDAALKEIEYGLDVLKAHGVAVVTNAGPHWLGDPKFDPVLQELNRRKATVFVHPLSAPCCRNMVAGVPDVLIEFGADTTRCIASLVFNGATMRHPDINWIFCHGGGATAAVIERFLGGTQGQIKPGVTTKGVEFFAAKQPPDVLGELRKLHYDTAQATNAALLGALKTFIPPSQVLFATDYPYQTAEITRRQVRESGVFSAAELEGIERGNALRLFPRLA